MKVSRLFLVLVGTFLIPLAAHATTLVVTNTNDNLAGSLRQMIQDAGAGDTIVFNIPTSDPGYNATTHIYAIGLVSGELLIDKNLTIDGGTNRIKLQRISGTFRIVHITTGSVSLLNLTISNGLFNGSPGGGGINNGGSLTLRNCTLNSNSASFTGGAIYNVATGIATLVNCTFQGNTSAFSGQVITNDGDLTLNSCTLAANSASSPTVQNNGVAHVRNSIIAGAGSNGYDVGGAFVSDGYNFIGIQDPMHGSGFGLSGSHDQVGAVGSPANPQLGALVDNGGPTKTMAPSLASPVVDQGNSGLTTDQRGLLRPVDQTAVANAAGGDASDIGAFELGILQGGPTFTVNTIDEHSDGNCEAQDCTLWDAVNAADNNVNNDSVIQFAPNLTGTITTLLQSSGMNVLRPMTINGPGARRLTISGSNQGRVFNVANTATVVISGLTISNGKFTGNGGAIINAGNLTLQDCTLSNSQAVSNNGGGIYSTSAATLNNCTVVGNSAASLGGGVDCELGTVNVTNCTFVGNQSASGAGLTSRGTTTIRSSTFAGNLASTSGSQDGGGVLLINATADIMNTIIANNTGAIWPDLAQSGGSLTADYDLIRDGTGWNPGAQGVHNIVGQDPQFAAAGLTNNGGFTDTVALQSTSPAINAGNNAIAPSRDQRHYSRSGTADIGAFEFNGAAPPAVPLSSIVSRKTHGFAGTFDLPLNAMMPLTVESRSGAVAGNHTLVFTFANQLATVYGASVSAGTGSVSSGAIGADTHQYIVNLTGVSDAQTITVNLTNVTDTLEDFSPTVTISLGMLIGDVNGDAVVNAADATLTRNRSGQTADAANFRADCNVDGSINSADATLVRNRSGNFIPSGLLPAARSTSATR